MSRDSGEVDGRQAGIPCYVKGLGARRCYAVKQGFYL